MKLLLHIARLAVVSLMVHPAAHCQSPPLKELTVADYGQWSSLRQTQLSSNSEWTSYILTYDSGQDTLFVKGTKQDTQYVFPKGFRASFSENARWCAVYQPEGLHLIDMKGGKQRFLQGVTDAVFATDDKYAVLFEQEKKALSVYELTSDSSYPLPSVSEYATSPDLRKLAYISSGGAVGIVSLGAKISERTVLEGCVPLRKHLVWNEKGTALALLEEKQSSAGHKLYFIDEVQKQPKVSILDDPATTVGYTPAFTPLCITPDASGVFFYSPFSTSRNPDDSLVQVWDSNSPMEYKRTRLEGNGPSRPHLQLWKPKEGTVLAVTNDTLYQAYLTPDRSKALVFNPHQYEPQSELVGPTDYWLADLENGSRTLVLKKHSQKRETIGMSPNGRYVHYYRDRSWWVYDVLDREHRNISNGTVPLEDRGGYPGKHYLPHGCAGWSSDSASLIVYSEYDVWLLDAKGGKARRLTGGSASGTRYRAVVTRKEPQQLSSFDLYSPVFDLKEGLVLDSFVTKTKASGYHHWDASRGLSRLLVKNAALGDLKKASKVPAYIITEQKADVSPGILYLVPGKKERVLLRTNMQQHHYFWTKADLVSYTNREGAGLQGILQYPANYEKGKTYPMVVYIYEKQSKYLHRYTNPTLFSPDGFNATHYTSNGYFVLYSDISYEAGHPGFSAVDCVEAAVAAAIEKVPGAIGPIGLIGHSFGGYEATFIITQSRLFAAAVGAAACTDLVSHSLTADTSGRSQMWRYQTHQMRMHASLYEDYEGFVANSAIPHLPSVTTPLLSWTGEYDRSVDPQQSIALHMAMRSLRKRHVFLLYAGQPHALARPESQKDASVKTKAWFDFYLKGMPFPEESGLH